MQFAKRMEAFGTGIFAVLLERKKEKILSLIHISEPTRPY